MHITVNAWILLLVHVSSAITVVNNLYQLGAGGSKPERGGVPYDMNMNFSARPRVVDVGVNLAHKAFHNRWKDIVHQSIEAGVDTLVLTGTCLKRSRQCMEMAQEWLDDSKTPNLYFTVGVHPHDAKTWEEQTTVAAMKELLNHPLAVAVGECGLDYNRNYSSKVDQRRAFKGQLELACDCNLPLFLHERDAHCDLVQILDDVAQTRQLPPIIVHCFTGTETEALAYIERGYYIGFTGTICKKDRGAPLRALLPKIPLDRMMLETDAPFMGFQKGKRKSSVPADCVDVAKQVATTLEVPFETVCETTTHTAQTFFGILER